MKKVATAILAIIAIAIISAVIVKGWPWAQEQVSRIPTEIKLEPVLPKELPAPPAPTAENVTEIARLSPPPRRPDRETVVEKKRQKIQDRK